MKATNFAPLLWLMLVLVLIPATLLLLKRSGLAARFASGGGRATSLLQVRESLTLGPNQRVVAVEVGAGAERRWLLLGVTPQQITTLHLLDAPPPGPAFAETAVADERPGAVRPSFEAMLARVRATAAKPSAGRPGASS
ncbi:MAG: hypothetical protein RL375_1688 [Pseudomonadota bacterium]|jgi:flagellar protein FliO/FliZ